MREMRDDPAFWDAASTRIVSTIRQRRANALPWRSARVWGPPLVTAAVLTLLIARATGTPASSRDDPTTRVMTAAGRAPNVAVLLASGGWTVASDPPSVGALMVTRP